jgi:hypothetical protein
MSNDSGHTTVAIQPDIETFPTRDIIDKDALHTLLRCPKQEASNENSKQSWLNWTVMILTATSNVTSIIFSLVITSMYQIPSFSTLNIPSDFSYNTTDNLIQAFKSGKESIYQETRYGTVSYIDNKIIWCVSITETFTLLLFVFLIRGTLLCRLKQLGTFSSFDMLRLWNYIYLKRFILEADLNDVKVKILVLVVLMLAITSPISFVVRMKMVSFYVTELRHIGNYENFNYQMVMKCLSILSTLINLNSLFLDS